MKQQIHWRSPFAIGLLLTLSIAGCGGGGGSGDNDASSLSPLEALGKDLFFDENLSSGNNQSCGSCHAPAAAFADPSATQLAPVSEGSALGQFGNRNAPTAAYAKFIPDFNAASSTTTGGTVSNFRGGQFLDGRAVDLVAQAKGPFLNPKEMNNGTGLTGRTNVVNKVMAAAYAGDFEAQFGPNAFADVDTAYDNIAVAIAAFEESGELNPFTSKFDLDRANFTPDEEAGFLLFNDPNGAKCGNCHSTDPDPVSGEVLFTDFNYFNVGTPPNPNNPTAGIDEGLGDDNRTPPLPAPQRAAEKGKFRTPTLRNVELTAPYMHNGRYQTLLDVIRHYDIVVSSAEAGFTPAQNYPEVDSNIAAELNFGDPNFTPALGLSVQQENQLIAFLLTLTDGYTP